MHTLFVVGPCHGRHDTRACVSTRDRMSGACARRGIWWFARVPTKLDFSNPPRVLVLVHVLKSSWTYDAGSIPANFVYAEYRRRYGVMDGGLKDYHA